MAQDLALAQSHAFSLSRILMVPITLFKSGDEFGVLPSDELDDEDDLEIVHEYFPPRVSLRPACPCRWRPVGRKGSFAAAMCCNFCQLRAAPLPPSLFAAGGR